MNWKSSLADKKFRIELLITAVFTVLILYFLPGFLDFVESRPGIELPDPLLGLFVPVDVTWLTFSIIYLSVVIGIISFLRDPRQILFAVQAYVLLILFRMAAMYLTPFAAPDTIIPLNDPFVQSIASGDILTKDLFFSGHTATLFLIFLVEKKFLLKILFLVLTIAVAICVLIQHVHYSVDVLAAPFFSFGSYYLLKLLKKKLVPE
jgi:membrane-associated phospholipid phosphatase